MASGHRKTRGGQGAHFAATAACGGFFFGRGCTSPTRHRGAEVVEVASLRREPLARGLAMHGHEIPTSCPTRTGITGDLWGAEGLLIA